MSVMLYESPMCASAKLVGLKFSMPHTGLMIWTAFKAYISSTEIEGLAKSL